MKKTRHTILLLVVIAGLFTAGLFKKTRTPAPDGLINLAVPAVGMDLKSGIIWGDKYHISSENSPQPLPAGSYYPTMISVKMIDQDRVNWEIRSTGPWGDLYKIKVKPDAATELKPGPPLLVQADVNISGRDVSIQYAITGQAGEHYKSIYRDGNLQRPPKLQILDDAGKILKSGQFEYG
jgi:hypothetical protein